MTSYSIHVERLASISLAVIRSQVLASDLSRVVPEGCGQVWEFLRAQGIKGGRHVAVYWDTSIRLEVGVEMSGSFSEGGNVIRSATPAGVVATATHYGPYKGLGSAHAAIHQWCQSHGYQLAGPKWEIYGHWQTKWNDDPSQIRTDVCYLLSDAALT
jgi:effector-binding domain-containing protein